MAAVRMYEEDFASREDIDEGMKLGAGHPMGPLTLCDFIGLDVLHAVCNSLYEEFKRDEYAPPPLMKRMIAAGRLGENRAGVSMSTDSGPHWMALEGGATAPPEPGPTRAGSPASAPRSPSSVNAATS